MRRAAALQTEPEETGRQRPEERRRWRSERTHPRTGGPAKKRRRERERERVRNTQQASAATRKDVRAIARHPPTGHGVFRDTQTQSLSFHGDVNTP